MSEKQFLPVGEKEFAPTEPKNQYENLLELLPRVVAETVAAIPEEYFELQPHELKARIEAEGHQLTTMDQRLRLSFWNEYHTAMGEGRTMTMNNVYAGSCTKQYFYKKILTDAAKLAFVCQPPQDYMKAMEECLMFGIDRIRELLSLPFYDKGGRLDSRFAAVLVKAVQLLDLRVKGAVVQKIESRTLNVNAQMTGEQMKKYEHQTLDEVNAKLAELEKTQALKNSPLVGERREVILEQEPVPLLERIQRQVAEEIDDRRSKDGPTNTTGETEAS